MHYANHKVNGRNYGVAWKPTIAAMPLATTRNAISEAMNVFHTNVQMKCEDTDNARALHTLSPPERKSPTHNNWLA